MNRLRSPSIARFIVAFYALAMLAVGFTCKSLVTDTSPTSVSLAYTLPDGTVPALCTATDIDGKTHQHAKMTVCDACLVAMAAGLLPKQAFSLPASTVASVSYVPCIAESWRRLSIQAPPSRAPPLDEMIA